MAKRTRRPTPSKRFPGTTAADGRAPSVERHTADDPQTASSGPPGQHSPYVEAMALYEQAIRTLQQHNYSKAADLLRHVLSRYPEERELMDRARLYVGLCERHLEPPTTEPGNTRERLYAATLALNAGRLDDAIAYLDRVMQEEPSNDQAAYMLAVAHSWRGEPAVAIPYLQQAIELNGENRALARLDPDLESLRDERAVAALLQPPSSLRQAPARRPGRMGRRQTGRGPHGSGGSPRSITNSH